MSIHLRSPIKQNKINMESIKMTQKLVGIIKSPTKQNMFNICGNAPKQVCLPLTFRWYIIQDSEKFCMKKEMGKLKYANNNNNNLYH